MNLKNKLTLTATLCCSVLLASAQQLKSPDGNLVMNFSLNGQGAPEKRRRQQKDGLRMDRDERQGQEPH